MVVAPTTLHIGFTKEKLSKDFQLAAQNCWVKGSGAYTGEIRCSNKPQICCFLP